MLPLLNSLLLLPLVCELVIQGRSAIFGTTKGHCRQIEAMLENHRGAERVLTCLRGCEFSESIHNLITSARTQGISVFPGPLNVHLNNSATLHVHILAL